MPHARGTGSDTSRGAHGRRACVRCGKRSAPIAAATLAIVRANRAGAPVAGDPARGAGRAMDRMAIIPGSAGGFRPIGEQAAEGSPANPTLFPRTQCRQGIPHPDRGTGRMGPGPTEKLSLVRSDSQNVIALTARVRPGSRPVYGSMQRRPVVQVQQVAPRNAGCVSPTAVNNREA